MSALNLTQVLLDSGISDDIASIKDFSLITLVGVCISGFVQISQPFIVCFLKVFRRKTIIEETKVLNHNKNSELKLDDNYDKLTNSIAEDSTPNLAGS
jgi:hypothetical protein